MLVPSTSSICVLLQSPREFSPPKRNKERPFLRLRKTKQALVQKNKAGKGDHLKRMPNAICAPQTKQKHRPPCGESPGNSAWGQIVFGFLWNSLANTGRWHPILCLALVIERVFARMPAKLSSFEVTRSSGHARERFVR